jgi:hypothetical protein
VYSLGEAARASGKSKPTIAKAIKTGRISAIRQSNGSYQIDPAELHRVYPLAGKPAGKSLQSLIGETDPGLPGELEKWRALAIEREETIRKLWERLDTSEAERRRVQERLTALLTHRSTASVPAVQPAEVRMPWWRRWFR